MDRIQPVEHHGVLVGLRLLLLVRQSLGMRAMMDAARVEGGVSRLDIVFTEKIAVVVEEELVVIGIAMEERNAQRLDILLERPGQEAADDRAFGEKGRMGA